MIPASQKSNGQRWILTAWRKHEQQRPDSWFLGLNRGQMCFEETVVFTFNHWEKNSNRLVSSDDNVGKKQVLQNWNISLHIGRNSFTKVSPLLSSVLFCIFSVANVWCISSSPLSVPPSTPSLLPSRPPKRLVLSWFFLVRGSLSCHCCLDRGQAVGFCKVSGGNLDCNRSYINKVELQRVEIELNWTEKLVWPRSIRNTHTQKK